MQEAVQVRDTGRTKYMGKPVTRLEDLKIIRGKAGYTDDIDFADQHHVAILRSPYAHAKIIHIDISKALSLPGVTYVLTGDVVASLTKPITSRAAAVSPTSHYIMASKKARYFGEPVAAVVAVSKYIAHDALDLIDVDYEPLPTLNTVQDALKPDAPLLYDEIGTNLIQEDEFIFGDPEKAFKDAAHVVKERFSTGRYSSTPLEPYVINAKYDEVRDELLIYANDQQPGRTTQSVAKIINFPVSKIRLIVPVVGGGFGNKLVIWQYVSLIGLLALLSKKPVKWVQTRSESLIAPHRPSEYLDAELAVSSDGKILGMRFEDYLADGNWPFNTALYALGKLGVMSGLYNIKDYSFKYHCVATNEPPIVQDRGVAKPFMTFVIERLVNIAAKTIKLDPAEMRFANFISPKQMPYTTPTGEYYESGNYPEVLKTALRESGYPEWKKKQETLRKQGRYIGIGVACGLEPGTSSLSYYYLSKKGTPEFNGSGQIATVEMTFDGTIRTYMNGPEIGTGHVTSIAQVLADIFGLKPEDVMVDPYYESSVGHLGYAGTYGNGFQDVYLGAYVRASDILKSKLLRIASYQLKTETNNLEIVDGGVLSILDAKKRMTFAEIAAIAYNKLLLLPPGEEPGLKVVAGYINPTSTIPYRSGTDAKLRVQLTHSNSSHVVVVEVDPKTGRTKFLSYLVVHDAGRIINPKTSESLVIGCVAAGIGQALYERFTYDENCINLCTTFAEYLKPTSLEVPDIQVQNLETPAPNTVLGTKNVGEGGAIASPAAVTNAIEDALEPFNVKITELPVSPRRLWEMISKK